jgi:hypothetical protein
MSNPVSLKSNYTFHYYHSRFSDWPRAGWPRDPVESRICYSSRSSDWFWGPQNLLSNGYGGKTARAWSWPLCSS